MSFELVFLDAVDTSLGRVDLESLPQQALMEMVIEGITNKEAISGDVDDSTDIEEWEGVTVEDGEVIAIHLRRFDLDGSLHLEWLPFSVRKFDAAGNHLSGTLDLAYLPTSIVRLSLGSNAFTASINLERLPERMEYYIGVLHGV